MTTAPTTAAARRLLLVHAHPDDETITTGGTIARYLAEGAQVTVVTCTLGEEGEVMEPRFAELTADRGDQLGGYRVGEITASLAALSASDADTLTPLFLGGVGRWRDSGMAGTPAAEHPRAFASTDHHAPVPGGPVAALAQIIRARRPQVVVTYDPVGGYGHPDHISAHEVTTAAVEAAATAELPGDPWQAEKLYWTVTGRGQLEAALAGLTASALPEGWTVPSPESLPSHPDSTVTASVDVRAVLDRKVAGLRAYRTQLAVDPSGTAFALTNLIAQPILADEAYILARGHAAPDADGLERDLFAGVQQ